MSRVLRRSSSPVNTLSRFKKPKQIKKGKAVIYGPIEGRRKTRTAAKGGGVWNPKSIERGHGPTHRKTKKGKTGGLRGGGFRGRGEGEKKSQCGEIKQRHETSGSNKFNSH